MISRSSLPRHAKLVLRRPSCAQAIRSRGLASAASGSSSASYETSESVGVKVAARDSHGPTTKLALVAKAGSRYQPLPGLAAGLEAFSFKNTQKRSALRITREAELLGGQLSSYHTREALVVEASFLRDDLPYFTELLGEVISQTKYTTHEFHEEIENVLHLKQDAIGADPAALALDAAHAVAFHTGLGSSIYPTSSTPTKPYLNDHTIFDFAGAAFTKSNIALVADGASQANVSKWTEQFFKGVPTAASGQLTLHNAASKYYGGEQRTAHAGGNALVIAFPGSAIGTSAPEIVVLAALLGGQPNIKWSSGFTILSKAAALVPGLSASASNLPYSDTGLLTIQLSGPADAVRKAAQDVIGALKSISEGSTSKEDLVKAIAKAKFDALEASQERNASLLLAGYGIIHSGKPFDIAEAIKPIESVTAEKIKEAAKTALDGKASVAAVGDLYLLPYAEELGLRV